MKQEIDTLIQQCSNAEPTANPLLNAPIEALCARAGITRERFYDLFAHRIATEFSGGRLSFDAADAAINWLHHYSLMGPSQELLDGFAWEIYRAFDAGEFVPTGDAGVDDPVLKFTRPLVEKALAGCGWHEA